jgi:cell division protein FtsW
MQWKSFVLLFSVLTLFVMGLAMVFNTTSAEILDRFFLKNSYHALIKQALYGVFLGFAVAAVVFFLGYKYLFELSGYFLAFGTFLLVLVLIPGVGQQINGARRWLWVGQFSFQPSEFVKYLIPLYYIRVITINSKPILLKNFLLLLGKIVIPLGLILIEPDNGSVVIVLVGLVVLFFLTKVRFLYWGLPLLLFFLIGGLVALQMPHVKNRMHVYLHPEDDLQGRGYQPYQAKIAIGSGGLLGRGLGESLQKLNYLPEARSDYIAAIFCEEFGFVGILFLIFLYMAIGYMGLLISMETEEIDGFYIVSILTFLICFQAILNLGVVSGLLPSKGASLPFFSQGVSSLLANFMVICIILDIAKSKKARV